MHPLLSALTLKPLSQAHPPDELGDEFGGQELSPPLPPPQQFPQSEQSVPSEQYCVPPLLPSSHSPSPAQWQPSLSQSSPLPAALPPEPPQQFPQSSQSVPSSQYCARPVDPSSHSESPG